MEEGHRGLGVGGGWAGFQSLVYDPKLAAGRGVEFSAAAQAGDVSSAVCYFCCCVHFQPCISIRPAATSLTHMGAECVFVYTDNPDMHACHTSCLSIVFLYRKKLAPWMTQYQCITTLKGWTLYQPAPAGRWTPATRATSCCRG